MQLLLSLCVRRHLTRQAPRRPDRHIRQAQQPTKSRPAKAPSFAARAPISDQHLFLHLQRGEALDDEMDEPTKVLWKNVFQNCGAFLRIHSADLPHLINTDFELLDSSRIHPAQYSTAATMARMILAPEWQEGDEDVPVELLFGNKQVRKTSLYHCVRSLR